MKLSQLVLLMNLAGLMIVQNMHADWVDVAPIIRSLNNQPFTANNDTLAVTGDPAPNVVKQLLIENRKTYNEYDTVPAQTLPILKARYGVDGKWLDVTGRMRNFPKQPFTVSNDIFSVQDPAPGINKQLQITTVTAFKENSPVPAQEGEIVLAHYGDTSKNEYPPHTAITVTNNSNWGLDGVYLQCGYNTAVNTLTGSLASNSAPVSATYPVCPIPSTIYIHTAEQYFTFPNTAADQGITITNQGGLISVNGAAYSKSGDHSIPGLDAPLTSETILNGFKTALHALSVNLAALAAAPANQRLAKLISLQTNDANQIGMPTLGLQFANFAKIAPTQLKGTLPDNLMAGLVSLMTNVSKYLAAVSLSAAEGAILQAHPELPANTALNNAINALLPLATQAASLEKVFDGLIEVYNKSIPKLDPAACLNLLV